MPLTGTDGPSTPESPPLDPGRLNAAFEHVAGQSAGATSSFAALAVARRDGLVRAESWSGGRALDESPRSTVASITKPITATAVLQMVEAGRLALTEPITNYLPDVRPPAPTGAGPAEPLTAWHILTHTAGMSDIPQETFLTRPPTRATSVDRLAEMPLRFAPGSAYAYTTDSYQVLAAIVERLAGQSWSAVLRERIFDPLGMTATTYDPRDPGPAGLPIEGLFGPAGIPRDLLRAAFISLEMPGGGLWSTAEDLARFGRAMLTRGTVDGTRILGRPFVELMTREHTDGVLELGTGRRPFYALGWDRPGLSRGSPASPSAFGHSGATGSVLVVDPENDLVVVHLRNVWGIDPAGSQQAVQAVYAALD